MLKPLTTRLWTLPRSAAPWIAGIVVLIGAAGAHAQTTVAGELAGQFSVSENGAATYQIPIQIPPGVAGVEPKLELNYNSQGGNGVLGMGWSLSGLSAIVRCPRTKAQDGVRGAINFDLNDRYCLDGERLIRVAGVEGAAGAEYRTERDGFSRIIANGQAGNGPASFTVKTKAGQTLEYGNTTDSRIEAQGKTSVSVWAVNRISDTRGTAMTVAYDEDAANGSFYPLRIDYAGGALLFDYEARTDFIPRYQAGSASKTTKRLMAIRTLMPDATLLRKLSLTYAYKGVAPNSVSVVTKVEVCDAQNKCLAPTSATYETGVMSWPADSTITPIPNADLDPISSNGGQIIVADWNGDGRSDFLWWEQKSGTNIWYISNGDGTFAKTTNLIAVANMKNNDGWVWTLHPMDWNGDGLVDFVLTEVSGQNRWFTNNGELSFSVVYSPIVFGAAFRAFIFGDWNGDGFTDVAETYLIDGSNKWFVNNGALGFNVVNNAINPTTARFASNSQCLLKSGDWNGDGITDVMCVQSGSNQNNRWFINDGSLQFTQFNNPIPAASLTGLTVPYFADINGDGISDVMWYAPTTGQNKWFLNDGKLGFSAPVSAITATEVDEINGKQGTFRFGDWNGDGITDALWYEPNSGFNRWYIGKGDLSFVGNIDPITPSTISGASMGLNTGDWTGKGLDDVMIYNAATGNTKWFRQDYKRDWLIKSISASSSKTTNIFMDSLNLYTLLTKDSGANKAVFPQIDIQPAMQVVSYVQQSNGLGGFNTTSYSYGGLKAESGTGRGMLGFRWVKSKELATFIESYTEYYQSFPYTGTPKLSETRRVLVINTLLKRTATTVACQNPQTAAACTVAIGNRYFPYASLVEETSWDLNGTAYPGVSSSYAYGVDSVDGKPYGDPTQITVTNQGDNSSKTTVNEYWPANTGSGNWILGRLKKATVTSVKP